MAFKLSPATLIVLAAIAIVVLPGLVLPSAYYFRVGALVFISALAVIGLNLLMGYAGQVSLGHAGFFAIGAYGPAILPAQFGWHPLMAAFAGVVLAAALAFVIGKPILRLKGHYLAVATLGVGMLITLVLTAEVAITGGPDGMAVARASVLGAKLRTPETWYWICGVLLILGVVAAINLLDSPTGRALRALHDSEVAAAGLGVDIAGYKLLAFVAAAIYAAVAGAASALLNGHVTPDVGSFLHSVEFVTMAVIGGLGSILGSIIGAAVLVILPQALTVFHDYETLALGVMIVLFMLFLREGIVPGLARRLRAGQT
ncbi:branched-chain amino acid ABC transporter permease [Blastochloris viridis]|uniref:Branched-chain amino acid transport system permease protein LivM n=1 Tax=Blastochloris viridis TaxID=1079 RepID=A0A0H5B8F9_BLAVI|nr:branched-chain amino acid ABC transporter permease [Blastochloris viridis]ALK08259.1 High-affinity branched-chain amino acid transport system permease protein LivH [Blastochloris viridis]BAR98475.1 branched-chain amino acid transport system permease protein LivM [Blastochloris viridis]CUU44181.1 LIV-I protein H [Blastochloris viridis]